MGLQARLMSQALRKLTANIKRTNTLVIFINQIRMKIGVMFGNPETTTGGNALKFYASVRIDIRRIGSIKKGDEVIGSETRVKVVKNKVAPPFRQAEFDILYGEGISREGEVLEIGVNHGVLEKSGAWYIYNGDRLGQGKDNARDFLQGEPRARERDRGQDPREGRRGSPRPVAAPEPRGQEGRAPACPQARREMSRRSGWHDGSLSPAELKARALRHLVRREHSRAELARKLAPHADRRRARAGVGCSCEQESAIGPALCAERARVLSRKYGPAGSARSCAPRASRARSSSRFAPTASSSGRARS